MKATTYSATGKESGSITLPDSLFAQTWNSDLVHEVVTSMQSNARSNSAHSKDRSEVRGGGKKPWRQKGTGRARHGSVRSPIWVGGGVAFGPRNDRNYTKKINHKARLGALASVLTKKNAEGEVYFLESFNLDAPKTKEVKELLANMSSVMATVTKRHNAVCIVLPETDQVLRKSFSNVDNVEVVLAQDLNPVDILSHKNLLIVNPDVSLKILEERMLKQNLKNKNSVTKETTSEVRKEPTTKKRTAKKAVKATKEKKETVGAAKTTNN